MAGALRPFRYANNMRERYGKHDNPKQVKVVMQTNFEKQRQSARLVTMSELNCDACGSRSHFLTYPILAYKRDEIEAFRPGIRDVLFASLIGPRPLKMCTSHAYHCWLLPNTPSLQH